MAHQNLDQCASLERFRNYLELTARLQLNPRLQGRCDPADVIQDTFLAAHKSFEQFRGQSDGELLGWLRQILANLLKQKLRSLQTLRRDLDREQSLERALEESSARLEKFLAANQSTPSQRAGKAEEKVRLADALAQLPETQRLAVELKHLRQLPVEEVAQIMNKSPGAVGSLLQRGLCNLRQLLEQPAIQNHDARNRRDL